MEDEATLLRAYEARFASAEELSGALTRRVREALEGFSHIDRISFRPKAPASFITKALSTRLTGERKYDDALRQIEDQVAGRVIVFFRDDLAPVTKRLRSELGPIEAIRKEPVGDSEFGYESEHLIFVIPNHLKPTAWINDETTPLTFEMQVRTLFMHAWAEPQHDLGYKPGVDVPVHREHRRSLAWVAASAWGADRILSEIAGELGVTVDAGAGGAA